MGGRQVVPGAAPRQRELERDVGVVVERPVGVAEGVVRGKVVPDRLTVGQMVGADRSRVADVDHTRVGDVQGDAKAQQEGAGDGEPGGRRRGAKPLPRAAEAVPEHPHQQIQQGWIRQRNADPDVAVIEVDLRDPERQEHKEVQVDHARLATEVHQPQQEDHRERDPDVRRIQLVPELPGIAACHLPGDLVAGPGLADLPRGVVDYHLHAVGAVRIEVDLPRPRL